jgi:hypothetical protein
VISAAQTSVWTTWFSLELSFCRLNLVCWSEQKTAIVDASLIFAACDAKLLGMCFGPVINGIIIAGRTLRSQFNVNGFGFQSGCFRLLIEWVVPRLLAAANAI